MYANARVESLTPFFLEKKRNKYYYLEMSLKEFQSYYKIKSTNSHLSSKFVFHLLGMRSFLEEDSEERNTTFFFLVKIMKILLT